MTRDRDWDIEPYFGVGPLRLGATIEEVRLALPLKVKSFKKVANAAIPADFFPDLGICVYYRAPGICNAFEFAGPISPQLLKEELLGRPFAEVAAWLKTLDDGIQFNDAGLSSPLHGIGLYAPNMSDDPSEGVESVIAFERGYYD